jgi:alkylated DNA repair protein (DNA oxidative demethylase)
MTPNNYPLWENDEAEARGSVPLADGATLLRGFAIAQAERLIQAVNEIAAQAPFRHMVTPGGQKMSVAMTNCGAAGWVSDRRGYRYDAIDPGSGRLWPPMPQLFEDLSRSAAAECRFTDFTPEVCLINRYEPGARMSLHQDKDERDFTQPIVSVSLGLPAVFLFGGAQRSDRPKRVRVESGDIVVWGGPARMAFHGVAPLADGCHSIAGKYRFNLTFRRAR